MAEQNSSPDWLPAGWTMDVRVRKGGKKDRCYTDPSNERKFYSKPDVLRYLKDHKINDCRSEETNKSSTPNSTDNFEVKKSADERLPPGWIKETRTRKGRTMKKDLYYFDPEREYEFRSMKDVFRYIEKGEVGKNVCKLKEKGHMKIELEDDKLSSPAGDKSSVMGEEKDEEILEEKPDCTTDCKPLSENASNQPKEAVVAATDIADREGNKPDLPDRASSVKKLPEKRPLEKEPENPESKKVQRGTRKPNGPELPRRASSRLAGVEVPLLELKPISRVRQGQPLKSGTEVPETDKPKQECNNVLETEPISCPNVPETQSLIKTADKKQPESPLDLSVTDSWMSLDPCIEFAIKTLTGALPVDIDLGSGEKKADDNNNPGSTSSLDLWSDPCIEFAVKTLTGEIPVGDACQQVMAAPALQHTGNRSGIPDSGDNSTTTLLHQHVEGKRPTIF